MTVITPAQAKQANLRQLVIRASAGTGKTFQLSNRFLQLVLAGQPADQILATTFTRKAAGEILQRVMSRLAVAAASDANCRKLAQELESPELSRAQCRNALKELTGGLHRLRISTLDAFFLQATQSLSLELGLPPTWRIADEHEELLIRDQAIAEFIEGENHQTVVQLMHWLTKGEARRGIHDLVRDTISDSYEIFQDTSQPAWHVLTRQATLSDQELRETISELTHVDAGGRIEQGIEEDCRRAERGDWKNLIKKGIAAKIARGETRYYRIDIPHEVLPAYRRLITHAVAEQRNRIVAQTESTYQLLSRFHAHFEAAKSERRVLLFSDLAKRLEALQDIAHLRHLAFRLDASVDSLLLDEFQDTSLSQWNVIRPFAAHAANGPRGSFLCVGDQKQAIYGWRGGNAELLDAVSNELLTTQELTLDTSFRSSQPVIDTVNRVNQNLTSHSNLGRAASAASEWVQRFPRHETARVELPGYVTLQTTRAAAEDEEQSQVTIRHAVDRIQDVVRQASGASVAVLVRTNESVGRFIYELHRRGIEASEEGGNPLVDSAAVQLVLSLITLCDHPGDTVARYHLSRSPWGAILGLTDHTSEEQAIALADSARRSLADAGYGRSLLNWADQLKVFCNGREWRRLGQLVELGYLYQNDIEHPRTIGLQHQTRVSQRCDAFVDFVQTQRVADPTEDPVRVMTIHQAKGLQFDYVVLPDLDRKLFGQAPRCVFNRPQATDAIDVACRYAEEDLRQYLPARFRRMFDAYFTEKAREELCVLYVAMTRAKHAMDMIIAPSRKSENRLPLTSAGLIRGALTNGQPLGEDEQVYSCGQPNWLESFGSKSTSDQLQSEQPAKNSIPAIVLAKPSKRSIRSRSISQPSSMEGDGRICLADRLSPKASSMQFGSLIHAFCEQVEWLDQDVPDDQRLIQVAERLDADPKHARNATTRFREMLSQPEIAALLSREYYSDRLNRRGGTTLKLEVRQEQPIMVAAEDRMVVGAIDRLVLFTDGDLPVGADVVDFKTDAVQTEDEMTRRVAHYRPQLDAYVQGVCEMLQLPKDSVTARLVFLSAGAVVRL